MLPTSPPDRRQRTTTLLLETPPVGRYRLHRRRREDANKTIYYPFPTTHVFQTIDDNCFLSLFNCVAFHHFSNRVSFYYLLFVGENKKERFSSCQDSVCVSMMKNILQHVVDNILFDKEIITRVSLLILGDRWPATPCRL